MENLGMEVEVINKVKNLKDFVCVPYTGVRTFNENEYDIIPHHDFIRNIPRGTGFSSLNSFVKMLASKIRYLSLILENLSSDNVMMFLEELEINKLIASKDDYTGNFISFDSVQLDLEYTMNFAGWQKVHSKIENIEHTNDKYYLLMSDNSYENISVLILVDIVRMALAEAFENFS